MDQDELTTIHQSLSALRRIAEMQNKALKDLHDQIGELQVTSDTYVGWLKQPDTLPVEHELDEDAQPLWLATDQVDVKGIRMAMEDLQRRLSAVEQELADVQQDTSLDDSVAARVAELRSQLEAKVLTLASKQEHMEESFDHRNAALADRIDAVAQELRNKTNGIEGNLHQLRTAHTTLKGELSEYLRISHETNGRQDADLVRVAARLARMEQTLKSPVRREELLSHEDIPF